MAGGVRPGTADVQGYFVSLWALETTHKPVRFGEKESPEWTLASRIGDRGRAAEHLTTATTMYREMGMDFWVAQAETALRSLGSEAA